MIAATVSWSGAYALPASAAPVAIAVQLHGRTATVSLGPGHSGATEVSLGAHGTRVRFSLPGLPKNVVFDGSVHGAQLDGTVRQGSLRGTFALRSAVSRIVSLLGVYRSNAGAGVAVLEADGLAPFLIEVPSGEAHGIGSSLTGLRSSLPRSPGFDRGFFPALGDWLRGHRLTS